MPTISNIMKKSVLLIDPPFQKFMGFSKGGIPLGLLSLAGKLKRDGYSVDVLDSDYNPNGTPYPFVAKMAHYDEYLDNLNNGNHPIWENITSEISDLRPDIVGVSMISTKLRSGLRVAQIAKDLGVERIIAGGPHVTMHPEDVLGNGSPIDSAVQGEGDGEGVFERALKEKLVTADRIKDIKSLAWPARESLIGLGDYNPTDLGFVMSSRGCPWTCNFCCSESLWGRTVTSREISDVADEMDSIRSNYGTNKFYLVDDTFTLRKKRVGEFCDSIQDKNYEWSCLTRVDALDESILEKMINSGCSLIKVGVESGSQRVLDLMDKRISISQIENTAKLLNRSSMKWLAYLMVGTPGETPIDVNETMDLVNRVQPSYVSAAVYTPYAGTGFLRNQGKVDFALEEANHHSLNVLAGDIPRGKIMEFMEFADRYNAASKAAQEIYKC